LEAVYKIVEKNGKRERSLIAMLQDIQREKGYLPKEALKIVAAEVDVPLSRLYGLATFYKAFSLVPRGRHIVNVCTGTACHVRGAGKLVDKLEQELKVNNGETTEDGRFTLEEVRCVGCCGLAPVIVVDENFHGKLSQKDIGKMLAKYE